MPTFDQPKEFLSFNIKPLQEMASENSKEGKWDLVILLYSLFDACPPKNSFDNHHKSRM
jgi:hypothetical protein